MTQTILLLLALVLANMPWFSERLFFVIPLKGGTKHTGWCLLELIVMYFVTGGIAHYAELSTMGQAFPQGWEVYATTGSLVLVCAFPGLVYRYFWLNRA